MEFSKGTCDQETRYKKKRAWDCVSRKKRVYIINVVSRKKYDIIHSLDHRVQRKCVREHNLSLLFYRSTFKAMESFLKALTSGGFLSVRILQPLDFAPRVRRKWKQTKKVSPWASLTPYFLITRVVFCIVPLSWQVTRWNSLQATLKNTFDFFCTSTKSKHKHPRSELYIYQGSNLDTYPSSRS